MVGKFRKRTKQHIEIRAARRDERTAASFATQHACGCARKGSMNEHTGSKHRDAAVNIHRLRDIRAAFDIQDRRDAATELGAKAAGEELRLIDRVRVEHTEQTAEVKRI